MFHSAGPGLGSLISGLVGGLGAWIGRVRGAGAGSRCAGSTTIPLLGACDFLTGLCGAG